MSHDREVDRAVLALVDVLILGTDVERALEFAQRAVDADARCQREGFDGGLANVEVGLGVVGIQRGEVNASPLLFSKRAEENLGTWCLVRTTGTGSGPNAWKTEPIRSSGFPCLEPWLPSDFGN